MATLKEALATSLEGYEQLDVRADKSGLANVSLEPTFNPMLRCPLPPVDVTPDTLRQFYLGGQIPQTRLLNPPNSNLGSGSSGGSVTNTTTIINNSSSSTSASLTAKTASITTSIINANQIFSGSLLIAKSFQLLSVSASGLCRVELYGTQSAQLSDLGRGLDVAPTPGTQQNLISDVVLDTNPYQWVYQNRLGANNDSVQSSSIYINITNLATVSAAITVTIAYVGLES